MADVACNYAECQEIQQLVPYEYQGWFIVLFLIFGTLAILYGLYLMTGENVNV